MSIDAVAVDMKRDGHRNCQAALPPDNSSFISCAASTSGVLLILVVLT
jgi:hypothetical protein